MNGPVHGFECTYVLKNGIVEMTQHFSVAIFENRCIHYHIIHMGLMDDPTGTADTPQPHDNNLPIETDPQLHVWKSSIAQYEGSKKRQRHHVHPRSLVRVPE